MTGGKKLLQTRDPFSWGQIGTVLELVKSCAGNDSIMTAVESVLRAQIAKGGDAATKAIQTNRLLKAGLSKLSVFVKVADVSSYVAELTSGALIGSVAVAVFGRGKPQSLGAWSPTCSSPETDSTNLFKNLALQDEFADSMSDLTQHPNWTASTKTAVQPVRKCTPDQISQLARVIEATWGEKKAAAVVASAIRSLAPSVAGQRSCITADEAAAAIKAYPFYFTSAQKITCYDTTEWVSVSFVYGSGSYGQAFLQRKGGNWVTLAAGGHQGDFIPLSRNIPAGMPAAMVADLRRWAP